MSISKDIDMFLNAIRHTRAVKTVMNRFGKEEVVEFADDLMSLYEA